MVWSYYMLKFRLLAPMHIGYRKVGNLMQTRKYVPGKNLWAAITARLTRDYHDGSKSTEYKDIGNRVAAQFRFGYLWPSLDGTTPCYFWDRDDFDYLFLDSYASTALDYSTYSTKEGSLHETELIVPVTRNEKQVYLIGDLWVKDGEIDQESWQRSMENLQLGGERNYGWGRLALCTGFNESHNESSTKVTKHRWQERNGLIILTLSKGNRITSHALAAWNELNASGHGSERNDAIVTSTNPYFRNPTKNVVGPIEPLVGREWSSFAGQKVCYSGVYFLPGCEVIKDRAQFVVDPFGRWASCG